MKKTIKLKHIARLSDILSKRQMTEVHGQLDESGWFDGFDADPRIVRSLAFEKDLDAILDANTPNLKDIQKRIGIARVLTDYLIIDF